jgi:hypothetical protein
VHLPAGRRQLGCTDCGTVHNIVAKALMEQTADAMGSLRDLENARLDDCNGLCGIRGMTGDIKAVHEIVQIVMARVRVNGLEPAQGRVGATPITRTVIMRPPSSIRTSTLLTVGIGRPDA